MAEKKIKSLHSTTHFLAAPVFYKIFIGLFLLMACSQSHQKKAKDYLNAAQQAYEEGNYDLAKRQIDSIKIKFPKAFKEIKAGFALMQDVRLAENRRNIAFCDSMLQVNYDTLKVMLLKFDYVRDEEYQEFGDYIPKIYPLSQTLYQNTVRSGVQEKGNLYLESVVVGSNIHHNHIRVSLPEGEYAETLPVTSEGLNYRFSTLTASYEIVRYSGENENGVAQFVYTFKDHPITVHFIGKRTLSKRLSNKEKEAISQSYELSSLLLEIERLKFEKEKSEVLIRYLLSKQTE